MNLINKKIINNKTINPVLKLNKNCLNQKDYKNLKKCIKLKV